MFKKKVETGDLEKMKRNKTGKVKKLVQIPHFKDRNKQCKIN